MTRMVQTMPMPAVAVPVPLAAPKRKRAPGGGGARKAPLATRKASALDAAAAAVAGRNSMGESETPSAGGPSLSAPS